jgi:hypothetical protein
LRTGGVGTRVDTSIIGTSLLWGASIVSEANGQFGIAVLGAQAHGPVVHYFTSLLCGTSLAGTGAHALAL